MKVAVLQSPVVMLKFVKTSHILDKILVQFLFKLHTMKKSAVLPVMTTFIAVFVRFLSKLFLNAKNVLKFQEPFPQIIC